LGYPRDGTETTLHLCVAIRAQQDALADLQAQAVKAMGTPLGTAELLETRVEMVELERTQAAVVAAQTTAAAGLLDKDLLHTTSPPNHRLLTAPAASE
jgi:hypothetical protein